MIGGGGNMNIGPNMPPNTNKTSGTSGPSGTSVTSDNKTDTKTDIKIDNKEGNKNTNNNPFAEAFNDMSKSNFGANDPFMNMFKNAKFDEELKDLDKDGFLKNLYGVLTQLSNSSENDGKMSQEELYPLFESLFEIILKEDLSTPLNQIKTSVNDHLKKNVDKVTQEEKEKYNLVISYIDTILIELKKAQPDKILIISTFQKLHEMNDFGADIFPDQGGMMGPGGMGGMMEGLMGPMGGAGTGSGNNDLKDIADKFFKK